jgi:signal transduction histidine kinase
MPELFRKIFPAAGQPTSGSPAAGAGNAAPDPAWNRLLEAAPVGLAEVRDGRVVAWNGRCRAALGAVVGGTEAANRRWLEAAVARLRASGRDGEVLAGRSDSLCLEVRLGAATEPAEAGLVAVRDVRDAGRPADDLAETVSTLSHELRTPLTSMKSSLNLVLAGEAGPLARDQARFLEMTLRNINRLERLVGDLLDVSRAGADAAPVQRREIDLAPVLREAVQMQEAAARTAGLELDASGLPASLPAHADPDRITQIVANVVGNSLKFTPAGGLVRIWSESRPQPDDGLAWRLAEAFFLPLHTFSLVVEDSGIGMTPAEIDRVFEPWYRGRHDGADGRPGSGLGLHITRGLVEAHGGRIRLASTPGRGTTVWIRLPRDPASEALLRAAHRLRQAAGPAADVAVLDGRPDRPVTEAVTAFLAADERRAGIRPVALAWGLVACVVGSRSDWQEAWDAFGAARPDADALPAWRFLTLEPAGGTNSQFPAAQAEVTGRT